MKGNTGRNTENLVPAWKKGQSGNPNGRPRGVRSFAVVLREQLEKGEITQEMLMKKLLEMGHKGDMKALSEIMDRMDGKAKEHITMESHSIVDLIQEGNKARQQAQAKAEGKSKR